MRKYSPGSDLFNGILRNERVSYNMSSSGENVNENRYEYLVDGNSSTYSCTKNVNYSFYEFSFSNQNTVKIKSYSILTRTTDVDIFPKSWTLSGFDGNKWLNVSTIIESKLTKANKSALFNVDFVVSFSKLRITQIGAPYVKSTQFYHLCFAGVDFFGSFGIHRIVDCSCKRKNHCCLVFVIIVCFKDSRSERLKI